MPVLVRDHVRPREGPALRAEAGLQLLEEAEVDVDLVVARAVERSDRRRRAAARGADAAVEEVGARWLVGQAGAGEGVGPVPVEGVDDGHHLAVELRVGLPAGPTGGRRLRGVGRLAAAELLEATREREPTAAAPGATGALGEQEEEDEPDDAEATPAERDPPPGAPHRRPRRPAQVVDLRGVEIGALVEPHPLPPRVDVIPPHGPVGGRLLHRYSTASRSGSGGRDRGGDDRRRGVAAILRPRVACTAEAWQSGRMHSP